MFHSSVLKSWHPSFLNIIHASVLQGVLAYQNTIIPKPSAKESLYMGILRRGGEDGRDCAHFSLEVTAENGHQHLQICLHPLTAMCPGELVRAPSPVEAAENFTADSYPLNHRYNSGNHLQPLPLDHRSLVMLPV